MSALFWPELKAQAARVATLGALFESDPKRAKEWTGTLESVTVDLSKQRIDSAGIELLLQYADKVGLASAIKSMFQGEIVNRSENRAVLHGLLRAQPAHVASGLSVHASEMMHARMKMQQICDAIHRQQAHSVGLVQATDIVNIGIGGSDLGPRLVTEALSSYYKPNLRVHFMTNVDAHGTQLLLRKLNPATTIFIVVSKSFGTQETRLNALLARQWIADYLREAALPATKLSEHFLAVSSNVKAAVEFGMAPTHVLPMSDTVGGRYSLWSTVGISAALAVGFEHFVDLLDGANAADLDYQMQPFATNLTVRLALTEIWNRNGLGHATRAVVPFDDRLARLPEFLQQLEMESNGKSVTGLGEEIAHETSPVVWGGIGTNVQHAFFQAIHQGTQVVPMDFVGVIRPDHPYVENHRALLANMLGQGAALLRGKSLEQALQESPAGLNEVDRLALARARSFPGNRPSTTFLLEQLTPRTLGLFLAMLENKVHTQSILWGVNAFDQWGVELGKTLATDLLPALSNTVASVELKGVDASTLALLAMVKRKSG